MRYITLPQNIETKVFVLDSNAISETPQVLKDHFPASTVQIIADDNTYAVAGKDVYDLCRKSNLPCSEPIVLPGKPKLHPDYAISEALAEKLTADTIPVAVGSGVINDLVKCAAAIKNLKYICLPTAPSVDGYTASGGAMSVNGQKKTVPCPAPYAVIADRKILGTAPRPMMAAGYADLMSKITGGVDWIIADELNIEKIDPAIWSMVQDDLLDNLADPDDLEKLFLGLAATGFAMLLYSDSRPASGGEHLCSHVWEMEHLTFEGDEPSHGFKVGIGVMAIAQLHEFILNTPVEKARAMAKAPLTREERIAEIDQLLIKGCYGNSIAGVALEKTPFNEDMQARRELIFSHWEKLQERMKTKHIAVEKLRMMLKNAQAPTHFAEIGLSEEQFFHGIKTAQLIRKRYTSLDMLYEAGLLDAALQTIKMS